MTRYARAGNSQKHQKVPEDATPWEKFFGDSKSKSNDSNNNEIKTRKMEKKNIRNKKFPYDKRKTFDDAELKVENNTELKKIKHNKKKHPQTPEDASFEEFFDSADLKNGSNSGISTVQDRQVKNKKHKRKEIVSGIDSNNTPQTKKIKNLESSNNLAENKLNEEKNHSVMSLSTKDDSKVKMSKSQLKKARRKAKLRELMEAKSNYQQCDDVSESANNDKTSQNDESSSQQKNSKDKKKAQIRQKLEKKRLVKGILLLPSKVERKIYLIKKNLREKGFPGETIKQVARKERRKEELKFRKSLNDKVCYNCRKTGHFIAECPLLSGDTNPDTGICFKCGSTEHTSSQCEKNVEGYPFAKCFICKEQGHINRDCPQNKRGIYPKGGKCFLCGNVNHLRKDCPTLKKTSEEEILTLDTIKEGKSVDAEIIHSERTVEKKKKPKTIKFN